MYNINILSLTLKFSGSMTGKRKTDIPRKRKTSLAPHAGQKKADKPSKRKFFLSPARKGVFRKLKQAPQKPPRKQMKTEPDYEKCHYATTE